MLRKVIIVNTPAQKQPSGEKGAALCNMASMKKL